MPIKIFIILLNWNKKVDTLETLDSLRKLVYSNYKIIVVDNNSTDGSQEAVKSGYSQVILIENKENLGYAEGNNVGIRYALEHGSDYIFIINNDIILDIESLSFLIKEMKNDKNNGISGPKTYFYPNSNMIQSAGGILGKDFNSLHIGSDEIDSGQYEEIREVDYVTGSAMLVKKEVFDKIGLFDPKYFMYWEETDFCFRAKKAGFKICIIPQAKIWHKGGINSTPVIIYYMARNKLLFLKKHGLGSLNIIKTYISSLRTILCWTIKSGWKDKKEERNMLIKALCDFWLGRVGKINI